MANHKSIPQTVVDEIRERADIVTVVGDHVLLKRAGANYSGLCPFHTEKSPSFSVHPGKRIFHCFGCGVGGDVFTFLMRVENISFPAALEKLAGQVGIDLAPYRAAGPDIDFGRAHELMGKARSWFCRQLAGSRQAREYLQARGLDTATIQEFAVGYAPEEWTLLTDAMRGQGFSADELVQFGLSRRNKEGRVYDYFRGRVMFPIQDELGRLVGFGGRVLGDGQPKYLNSPESVLYSKGRLLFNLNRAAEESKQLGGTLLLVEGYMDVIGLWRHGFRHAVATLGTALTESQVRKIAKVAARLVFAYDPDSAGAKATLRALPLVEKADLPVSMLSLPDGVDPDEFVARNGAAAMKQRLDEGQPVEAYLFEAILKNHPDSRSPAGKRAALKDLAGVFSLLPSPVSQQAFSERVSDRFGISEELVRKFFGGGRGRGAAVDAAVELSRPRVVSPLLQAERTLIHAFLCQPAIYRNAGAGLRVSDFTDPYCKRVLQVLAELDGDPDDLVGRLISDCEDEELRRFVTAELMLRPHVEEDKAETVVRDCFRELSRYRLEARKRELVKLVAGGGAGEETLREFKKITEELQSLIQGLEGQAGGPIPRAR